MTLDDKHEDEEELLVFDPEDLAEAIEGTENNTNWEDQLDIDFKRPDDTATPLKTESDTPDNGDEPNSDEPDGDGKSIDGEPPKDNLLGLIPVKGIGNLYETGYKKLAFLEHDYFSSLTALKNQEEGLQLQMESEGFQMLEKEQQNLFFNQQLTLKKLIKEREKGRGYIEEYFVFPDFWKEQFEATVRKVMDEKKVAMPEMTPMQTLIFMLVFPILLLTLIMWLMSKMMYSAIE
jgi:hypothetical protein